MPPLVSDNLAAVAALCQEFGVTRLDLFGSAATGRFDAASSDLDFVAEFADHSAGYAARYLTFAEALESLFGRPVDLVTERSIRAASFRHSVEASRRTVYESGDGATAARCPDCQQGN